MNNFIIILEGVVGFNPKEGILRNELRENASRGLKYYESVD